jgi:hypothetical protein
MPIDVAQNVGNIVLSIGALGTASFGLVDATKAMGSGGISNCGFNFVKAAVHPFDDEQATIASPKIVTTLHSNWINGSPLSDQKAIAKSLIKLRFSKANARRFAAATGGDPGLLENVADKIARTQAMSPAESDAYGRFDLTLTAMLDEAYNRADQKYRNMAKVTASAFAIVLAIVGLFAINPEGATLRDFSLAFLCGVLATPLAPIAKDVASALQAGVKVAQAIKK